YYEHKADLRDIHVHLEFENLLHRSGFKTLEEIQQVLQDHQQNKNSERMIISGLWTHFGYADEFGVPEYDEERSAWLNVLHTLLN
ncbi:alanine racemase, partial [Staphylococcus saprophyticus]